MRPIRAGVAGEFGCGQCAACRINRRRELTARFLLQEAGHTGSSSFVTLTYSDQEVRKDEEGNLVLCSGDLRNFVQRLRRFERHTRYCAVGEYGERSLRPHFHILHWSPLRGFDARLYSEFWKLGHVHVGEVTAESIGYVVGYVLKRMTKKGDFRLGGRPPEFCRWSKGLASVALEELKRCARANEEGLLQLPREFRLGGKLWPVPKYLRVKLKEEGYVFSARKGEALEAGFVQAMRFGSSVDQAARFSEFRSLVKEEVDSRRIRSRVLIQQRLKGVRRETF